MKTYVALLRFKSQVHFGQKEDDLTAARFWSGSEQLFSAIVNCISLMYGAGEVEALLSDFEKTDADPPFALSSTFLLLQTKTGMVYYLPRPMGMPLRESDFAESDLQERKAEFSEKSLKKVAYLPSEALRTLASGHRLSGYGISGPFLIPSSWTGDIMHEEEIPRVALDGVTSYSNIYYVSMVRFAPGAGLYFLLECSPAWERQVMAAVRLLGDEGLGGERTYGTGLFDVEFCQPPGWDVEGENRLLVSAYYPAPDEMDAVRRGGLSAYALRETGGYVYSSGDTGWRKPWMRLIREGSILNFTPKGALVDVTPQEFSAHRVVRYGMAYTLPWGGGA